MLDITLLAIGRLKDTDYQSLATEYLKRLRPFVRLKVIELAAEPFRANAKERAKELESGRILDFLNRKKEGRERSSVYLLAERGRAFTSPELAAWLDKPRPLILVMAGALGFSDDLYRSYKQISLSPLTFPHELARIVLLEQLYRAATLINKKEYHY